MEENISPVLEAYNWETMDTNERREIWEQNHLSELQNSALERRDPWHYLEGIAALEHLALIQDEIEQMHQIAAIENMEEEVQKRNNVEQIQLQQWEQHQLGGYAAIQEQLPLTPDQIEQMHQIIAIENMKEEEEEEQQQRNNTEQIQLQQWEQDQLEAYAIHEELQLINDEKEQLQQIETLQIIQDEEL